MFKAIGEVKPSLPVIMMTVYPSGDLTEEARKLGVLCLEKPIQLDELEDMIDKAVSERRCWNPYNLEVDDGCLSSSDPTCGR